MKQSQLGLSLIEIILVVATVGFIVVLLANLPNALGLFGKAKHISLARDIAGKQIEDKRDISFVNLVLGTTPISDSRISLLPSGAGIIEVEDCKVEICTNLEEVKHIKVKVSWMDNQKEQNIMLETFIGEGGLNQ